MTLSVIAGTISGVLAVATLVPYLWTTLFGTTRPSIISQSLWCVFALLAVAAQFSEQGLTWSMAAALATAFNNVVIVAVCLFGYGYVGHTRFDVISGVLALIGVALWQLTSDPFYALLFAIAASVFAGYPTYHKTFLHPETENTLAWVFVFGAGIFSLIALSQLSFLAAAFPAFVTLEALLVIALTLRPRKEAPQGRIAA